MLKASNAKSRETHAHAGIGTMPKMRNVVFGETHAKNDITANIAPV